MILRILLLTAGLCTAFKQPSSWGVVPRGGAELDSGFAAACDEVKNNIIEKANMKIEAMRRTIIDESSVLPTFGTESDTICNSALEEFALNAPIVPSDSPLAASTYDKKTRGTRILPRRAPPRPLPPAARPAPREGPLPVQGQYQSGRDERLRCYAEGRLGVRAGGGGADEGRVRLDLCVREVSFAGCYE